MALGQAMKVHQNIVLAGQDVGEARRRKGSAFCNEGKWANFIAPFLPDDCRDMTFVEIGCNAGLYLRLATERGFRHVWGVEQDAATCLAALDYRDEQQMAYHIINERIGEGFDWHMLPVADVTLLANVHYHMAYSDFLPMVDALRHRTRLLIVVSVEMAPKKHWLADARHEAVHRYFQSWWGAGGIELGTVAKDGDPDPRDMFSACFGTELERIALDRIRLHHEGDHEARRVALDFIGLALAAPSFDVAETEYYKVQQRYKGQQAKAYLEEKAVMMRDLKEYGQFAPILIDDQDNIIDGAHRTLTLRALGYESAIVRRV